MGKTRAQPVQSVSSATRWRMRAIFLCAAVAGVLLVAGVVSSFWQVGVVWVTVDATTGVRTLHSVSLDRGSWVTQDTSGVLPAPTLQTGLRVVAPSATFWPNVGTGTTSWSFSSRSQVIVPGVGLCVIAALTLLANIGKRATETPAGSCGVCGYDVRGVVSDAGVCPECGNPVRNALNRGA